MADSIFNRPRSSFEPRAHDERGRDLGGKQSRPSDEGATERRDPGADALLELARLIGQGEPFAPSAGRAGEPGGPDGRVADAPRASNSPDRAAQDRAAFARPVLRDGVQSQDQSFEDRLREPRFEERSSLEGNPQNRRDRSQPPYGTDRSDFLELSGHEEYPVAPRQTPADDRDDGDHDHREDSMTGQRQPAYGHQDEYADEYGEDEYGHDSDYEYETEHEPADQDDDPGSKRRSSTKVVIAVLALAVFGSAAAFGYRTMFRDAPSGPTPIIRADNSPTKVIPGGDASAKPVNERVGDNTGERLVRRDEDPVDVGATYRSGSGDSGAAGPLPDAGYPPPATVPAGGPGSSSDTRRVRTVTIRPDQSAAASDRAPPPPSRATPPPAAPPAAPQAPPPRQTAALSAPTTSGPPVAVAPEAAVPRAADAGGFVVQLSAQRSEADAQAAFRTMQGKYSTVLSGHQPLIRRKDLGERGIFYAAQVGPFGAKSDADQLCETLKSAGGTCFVQKN